MIKKLNKKINNFKYFYDELGFKTILIVLVNIIIGFLDGIGISMLIPMLELIGNTTPNDNAILLKSIFDNLGINLSLNSILSFMLLVFLIKGAVKYFAQVYQVNIYQKFATNLRTIILKYFNHINYK